MYQIADPKVIFAPLSDEQWKEKWGQRKMGSESIILRNYPPEACLTSREASENGSENGVRVHYFMKD